MKKSLLKKYVKYNNKLNKINIEFSIKLENSIFQFYIALFLGSIFLACIFLTCILFHWFLCKLHCKYRFTAYSPFYNKQIIWQDYWTFYKV